MAVSVRDDYQAVLDEQPVEVRNMVLAGLDQKKTVKQKTLMKYVTDWRRNTKNTALHN